MTSTRVAPHADPTVDDADAFRPPYGPIAQAIVDSVFSAAGTD